jgi:hypothetical protein
MTRKSGSAAVTAGILALAAILGACVLSSHGNASSAANLDATRSSGFFLLYYRDTLVEERYSRSPMRLEGQYSDRVRGVRVRYVASLADDGRVERLQTTSSRAGVPDTVRDVASTGDSLRVEENGVVRWVAGASGAQLILGPSGALIEQLLVRARHITSQRAATHDARDTVTLRTFEASGRGVNSLAIRWFGNDSASATVPGDAGITRLATPNGRLVTVHYHTPAGMRLVRDGSRH